MRRLILTLAALVTLSTPALAVGGNALAVNVFQPCSDPAASGSDVCQDAGQQGGNSGTNNPVVNIIKAAISILSFIIGIGAVIGIVVSGFRIITAGGDSQAVASARSGLIYSLIGLAVAVVAQALVALVLDKIG